MRPPLGADPYAYVGDDPATYVPMPWEPHIKMAARGDDVVPPFVKGIADPAALETYVNVDDLIDYFAAATIVMTTDGLVGSSGASDHFEYFDPQSGKFFVLPWDPDNTFGSQGETPEKLIYSKLGRNALTIAVRDRTDLRARYRREDRRGDGHACRWPTVQAKADAMYALIKDAAHADTDQDVRQRHVRLERRQREGLRAPRYANLQMQLGN